MEIMVIPSSGSYNRGMPAIAGAAQIEVPVFPERAGKVPEIREAKSGSMSYNEQSRYEDVWAAAKEMIDHYVVSDTKFTIFKDMTGQYITRFTNLRDGTVTYMPEPELVQFLQRQAELGSAMNVKTRLEITV